MRPTAEAALLDAVERAAPMHDRVVASHFVERPSPAAERRLRRWRARIAAGSERDFEEYLQSAGIDEAALRAGLSDVRLRDRSVLPPWAEPVLDSFRMVERDSRDPLLTGARAWLQRQDWGAAVAETAREGMLATLAARFWRIVQPVLEYEH